MPLRSLGGSARIDRHDAHVRAGSPINTTHWQTVGIKTIDGLAVGVPRVVEFDLPSTMLPSPGSLAGQSHYCLLALLHHPSDQFNNTQTNADTLAISERKVAQRNVHVVNFTGTLPPPNAPAVPLNPQMSLINLWASERESDLLVSMRKDSGAVSIVFPRHVEKRLLERNLSSGRTLDAGHFDTLVEQHLEL